MAKELHELNDLEEKVILVAVEMDDRHSRSAMEIEACLDELEDLIKTAGWSILRYRFCLQARQPIPAIQESRFCCSVHYPLP